MLIRAYVWLGDMPIAVVEGGQVYSVRVDHIGRPVFATTSAGTVVWQASYLPFGGVNVSAGAPIDLRFPGQWFQTEAGLYQNWMRDYDPTLGRYIEADPLGLVDGASVYGYALQNPGRWVDPTGRDAFEAQGYSTLFEGNTAYQWWDPHPEARGRSGKYMSGRGSNKCNMFVYDMLSMAGDPPGRDKNGTIPTASTWGNPLSNISGYVSIPIAEIRGGDIISNGHHVGIVIDTLNGRRATASASARDQVVVINDWGWRSGVEDDPTAGWRCTCDMDQ